MKLIGPTVILCALAAAPTPARAQSVSGHWDINARCGGSDSGGFQLGDHLGASRHGDCPSPRTGGLASSNNAEASWDVQDGAVVLSARSHVDFFGTRDDAGSAGASHDFFLTAGDLTFTDLNNPGRRGAETIAFHYLLGAAVTHEGASNCSPFQPSARAQLELISGLCRGGGTLSFDPSQGDVRSGDLASLPANGDAALLTTLPVQISLVDPQQFYLHLSLATAVLYCDAPPAAVGDATSLIRFSLPCGSPVFDLPPGITCNSPQLGIVNNLWQGPPGFCCPADFNGDGFLDFFDYDDYVNCFETGACPPGGGGADFNGDHFVDFFDYDDFVAAFESGC